MTDLEEKIAQPSTPQADAGREPAHAENQPMPDSSRYVRHKPHAEMVFDKAVYGGISYFAQAAAGIVLTHWLKYGAKGQKYFHAMKEWTGKNVISKISAKRGDAATEGADTAVMVTTMVMVGNLFLLPVKWLENRKPKVVRWINEKLNDRNPPTPEQRTEQEKDLSDLEKEPKQTWWSLLGGRAFGLGAVYSVLLGLGEERNKAIENWGVGKLQTGMKKIGLEKFTRPETKTNQYMHVAFNDVFYSMVSAGGLYIYSHFINPPKKCNSHPTLGCVPDAEIEAYQKELAADKTETNKNWASKEMPKLKPAPALSFQDSVQNKSTESAISVA